MEIWPLLALCAAIFLSGCQPDRPLGSAQAQPVPSVPALRILGYSDYVPPSVIKKFENQHRCTIEYIELKNSDDLLGRMKSEPHRYDLLIWSDVDVAELSQAGLIAKLDSDRLKGLENLEPESTHPGERYALPYCWGGLVVAYLKDRIPNPESSTKLLFSPPPGSRVLMLEDMIESFLMAALHLGKEQKPFDEEPLKAGTELLRLQSRNARVHYGNDGDMLRGMVKEDYTVALAYSGDAEVVAQQNPNVGYFIPKEGTVIWQDEVAISRDAPQPDLAYEFLNYILQPETMADISNTVRYPNRNRASARLLDPSLVANTALCPTPEVQARSARMRQLSPEESMRMATYSRMVRLERGETASLKIATPSPSVP